MLGWDDRVAAGVHRIMQGTLGKAEFVTLMTHMRDTIEDTPEPFDLLKVDGKKTQIPIASLSGSHSVEGQPLDGWTRVVLCRKKRKENYKKRVKRRRSYNQVSPERGEGSETQPDTGTRLECRGRRWSSLASLDRCCRLGSGNPRCRCRLPRA